MRSRMLIVAAASFALTSMVPAWYARGEDRPNSTAADTRRDAGQTASDRAGDRTSNASATDQKAIRETLATIVEDATTQGKASDLQNHIARADRDRASNKAGSNDANATGSGRLSTGQNANSTPANTPSAANAQQAGNNDPARAGIGSGNAANADLDSKIAQFQKDWKAKYNQDFKIRDAEKQVFTDQFARIDTSNFGDAARTAGERISPDAKDTNTSPRSDVNSKPGDTPVVGNNVQGSNNTNTLQRVKQTEQEARTDVASGARAAGDRADVAHNENRAMVSIPESHGAPQTTLTLVNDGGTWKVAVPGTIDNAALQANLAKHLDMVDQDKANWPSDVNDAYRAVSHHVFMAISGSGSSRTGLENPGANSNQGNPGINTDTRTNPNTGTNLGK